MGNSNLKTFRQLYQTSQNQKRAFMPEPRPNRQNRRQAKRVARKAAREQARKRLPERERAYKPDSRRPQLVALDNFLKLPRPVFTQRGVEIRPRIRGDQYIRDRIDNLQELHALFIRSKIPKLLADNRRLVAFWQETWLEFQRLNKMTEREQTLFVRKYLPQLIASERKQELASVISRDVRYQVGDFLLTFPLNERIDALGIKIEILSDEKAHYESFLWAAENYKVPLTEANRVFLNEQIAFLSKVIQALRGIPQLTQQEQANLVEYARKKQAERLSD